MTVPVRLVGELLVGSWLVNAGLPGVNVVEGPVESFLGQGPVGNVHRRIDPGTEALVAASRVPWKVRSPTGDELRLQASLVGASLRASARTARESGSQWGIYRGAGAEVVLFVRLSAKCEHDDFGCAEIVWTRVL